MKWLFVVLVVGVAAIIIMMNQGVFTPTDPKIQMEQFTSQVKPGMTWQQVMDIQPPRKVMELMQSEFDVRPVSPRPFDADTFAKWVGDGGLKVGFVFPYKFSEAYAVEIWFDGNGKVTGLHEPVTMGKLLEGNLFQ